MSADLIIIGGGLAGTEAAWQAAIRGLRVILYEMRPSVTTGAHTGSYLAELICSNSLGSDQPDRAGGVLKRELRRMNSLLMRCADATSVPAGGSLAVDREAFARMVTGEIVNHPLITVIRNEITKVPPEPVIIASGPLTSTALAQSIADLVGHYNLFFYDAIAPIVVFESINMDLVYRASRYGHGGQDEGDYINCPMTREEYEYFVDELIDAECIELKGFESELSKGVKAGVSNFFEGCLPVEILAKRGRESLAYGPMRPVGLKDPRTGRHPYAVLQLRQDNLAGTLYNMVGFQTNLKYSEQSRVFRTIPGLEKADFARFGQMHRNTFIYSPGIILPSMQFKGNTGILFAGQITGVEGYVGNIATGLLAGWNAARIIQGKPPLVFPQTTLLGALCHYVAHATAENFQPMKANFGILLPLEQQTDKSSRGKRARSGAYAARAWSDLDSYLISIESSLRKL